jgi:hypothetical protein
MFKLSAQVTVLREVFLSIAHLKEDLNRSRESAFAQVHDWRVGEAYAAALRDELNRAAAAAMRSGRGTTLSAPVHQNRLSG